MRLRTKKLLAREFLLLLSVLVVSFFAFLGSYGYNAYLKKQNSFLQDSIASYEMLSDSLPRIFYSKLQKQHQLYQTLNAFVLPTLIDGYLFFPAISQNRVTFFKTYFRFAKEGKIDSVWKTYRSNKEKSALRKMGIGSPQKLESYILSNIHTSDDIRNRDLATKYENKVASMSEKATAILKKQLDYKQQIRVGMNAMIILFLITFVGRYLVYGVIQSIKILKES